uniref:Uncharacterized protein n=1 Tax=Graphocephala atropunctata TaxID=36148 RepID=A0A1B6MLW6_9HEMI
MINIAKYSSCNILKVDNLSGFDRPDAAITDSTTTVTETSPEGCFIKRKQCDDHSQCGASCAMRRERLEQIRRLFANCYCQSIGHNLKDGSETSGLSNIIGNLAGKIYQKT